MPPQTRETAIVAICDEVEVASRKLRKTSATAIDDLVERIVYGKLHLGQLDASGLSMSDLRRISNVLAEIIKQSNRGRVGPVTSHDDDTAETVIGNVVAKPAQFETAKPAVAAVVIPASRGSDLLGVATTLNVAREVPTDSTATQLTETRLIRSKTPAVIVSDGDDLEIVDEIAAPSGSVLVPPVLSPLALAVAGDHAAAHDDVLASPPLTPGETLIGAPPATRAQPTSRVRRKSTVGPTGGSFD